MFSTDSLYVNFLTHAYFPDRLAGPHHAKSREEHLIQAGKLNRHFHVWLSATAGETPRPVRMGDLSNGMLKLAMAREVEPREAGGIGNSADTANKLYRHVKAVWRFAQLFAAEGPPIVRSSCTTTPYREMKRKPLAWYPEEIERIVTAAYSMPGFVGGVPAGDFWSAMVLVAMSLGVRISAQMSIPTANWNRDLQLLLVPCEAQKQREEQWFDLYPSATAALERLELVERGVPTLFGDWPFDGDRGWRALRRHLRRLLVKAGLFDKVGEVTRRDLFHKFRKTVGTEIAIKKGVAAAQEFLGHSCPSVTKGYIDERRRQRVKITDVMDDPGVKAAALHVFTQTA